jgi:hypothetical protein
MPVLDSPLLQSTLRDELRAAWLQVHATHACEGLYGFGVFTTDSARYLMATVFSEAELAASVADAVASFSEGGRNADLRAFALEQGGTPDDPALQAASLRWHVGDTPLNKLGSTLLQRSDALVRELDFEGRWSADDDLTDEEFEEDEDLSDPEVDEVFQVIVQVLRELDAEGIFGAGAERERLVLSVWQGDQSNLSRYGFAKALNPPAVVARFGRELNEGAHAYDQLYHGSSFTREDDVFE